MTDEQLNALMDWIRGLVDDISVYDGYISVGKTASTRDKKELLIASFGFLEDGLGRAVAKENIKDLPEHLRPAGELD